MKLIKPYFEIIPQQPGEIGMLKHIETCGRVAWKSEEKTTEDSYIKFIDMLKGVNHGSVLEHGTVYLYINNVESGYFYDIKNKYLENKYSKVIIKDYPKDLSNRGIVFCEAYITTNYRVLVENNWLGDLKYQCEPTEFHEKRVTVRFVCTIGISREFNRHRVHSITEQSTRYCNYSKDKFGNEVTFIIPCWLNIPNSSTYTPQEISLLHKEEDIQLYLHGLSHSEFYYFNLLEQGWKPQQAREVLPLNTATELIHTAFVSDWKHFFMLRTAKGAHPQAQELAIPLMLEFNNLGYETK